MVAADAGIFRDQESLNRRLGVQENFGSTGQFECLLISELLFGDLLITIFR